MDEEANDQIHQAYHSKRCHQNSWCWRVVLWFEETVHRLEELKNNEIWAQQDEVPRTLSHGDYIRCVIPGASDRKCMEDTLEVDQGLSLVQLHAATQTTSVDSTESNLMEVDVYGFGQDQICLEDVIPNTRNIRDALEAVWDMDIEEIAAWHEVLEPPIRRQSFRLVFFLMEMRVDSRLTSRSDDVFGLVEVIIRGHQISGDSISKLLVTWLRRRARRIQLLSQLRLDGMCDKRILSNARCTTTTYFGLKRTMPWDNFRMEIWFG